MKSRYYMLSLGILLTVSGPLAAAPEAKLFPATGRAHQAREGVTLMNAFFSRVKTFDAAFEQTIENERGRITKQASGHVALYRPGRFRWSYNAPEPQEIVGDGDKLWIYDKDLAQVTVKPLNAALGSTPAALIAGKNVVAKDYKIIPQGIKNGLYWVELIPKGEDYGFTQVLMGFANDPSLLHAMELKDNFGQTTRLSFHHVRVNGRVNLAQFRFEPPKGVDVLQQ